MFLNSARYSDRSQHARQVRADQLHPDRGAHPHYSERPIILSRETAAFADDGFGQAVYERGPAPDSQLIRKNEHLDPKFMVVAVTIRGLDVFDPTTGEVRSGSTDDITCWFLDTAYDGQSFFVRHAYFCGATEPYEKLKKALKAETDEGEWAKLYATTSVPFDPPKDGKSAVKVINHFGDEVLKVYAVGK